MSLQAPNETAEDVRMLRSKVSATIFVDGALRQGRISENKDGLQSQPIIVKFTTFRSRIDVYLGRKPIKGVYVKLDLIKGCLAVLTEAPSIVEHLQAVVGYADITCNLRVFDHRKRIAFSSIEELATTIRNYDL